MRVSKVPGYLQGGPHFDTSDAESTRVLTGWVPLWYVECWKYLGTFRVGLHSTAQIFLSISHLKLLRIDFYLKNSVCLWFLSLFEPSFSTYFSRCNFGGVGINFFTISLEVSGYFGGGYQKFEAKSESTRVLEGWWVVLVAAYLKVTMTSGLLVPAPLTVPALQNIIFLNL